MHPANAGLAAARALRNAIMPIFRHSDVATILRVGKPPGGVDADSQSSENAARPGGSSFLERRSGRSQYKRRTVRARSRYDTKWPCRTRQTLYLRSGQSFAAAPPTLPTLRQPPFGLHFETDFRDAPGLDFRGCCLRLKTVMRRREGVLPGARCARPEAPTRRPSVALWCTGPIR